MDYLLAHDVGTGGNKAVFFFTADGRVDFRALVRDLAQQLHARHPGEAAALIRRWLPDRERFAQV